MNIYIVLYTHKHGIDAYLVKFPVTPTVVQVVRCLKLRYEPSRNELIEINIVPQSEPVELDWQTGDAEEFDEFAQEKGATDAVNAEG